MKRDPRQQVGSPRGFHAKAQSSPRIGTGVNEILASISLHCSPLCVLCAFARDSGLRPLRETQDSRQLVGSPRVFLAKAQSSPRIGTGINEILASISLHCSPLCVLCAFARDSRFPSASWIAKSVSRQGAKLAKDRTRSQ